MLGATTGVALAESVVNALFDYSSFVCSFSRSARYAVKGYICH
jgi:hypothetical protein